MASRKTAVSPARASKGASKKAGNAGSSAAHAPANAMPTKEFFISVLTRDIELSRAILDLVDNCVDGARRVRGDPDRATGKHPKSSPTLYKGLSIQLTVNATEFVVEDNCGGISIEVATKYALRFGRDPKQSSVAHSIGHFGIGMKRALFKIGDHFRIESTTLTSKFVIDQKVSTWKDIPGAWEFPFESVAEGSWPEAKTGTIIRLTSLHPNVAEDFARDGFVSALNESLAAALQIPISLGLSAAVNGTAITSEIPKLRKSGKVKPVFRSLTYNQDSASPVKVRVYAGVGDRDYHHAGWNVFCNGRLVLASNQDEITGWGATLPMKIPKYHNEFDRFHGFVYFDSEDAGSLPWNTAKTGIDTDSPIYRTALNEMIRAMRPVIDMLNALKDEESPSTTTTSRAVSNAWRQAKEVPLRQLAKQETFSWPERKGAPSESEALVWIRYQRSRKSVERARRLLGIKSPDKIGEATFDYWEARQK